MTPDPARLRRIQLLSDRFHELQGLRVALAGACITLVVAAYALVWPEPTNNGAILALGVSFVPMIWGMPFVSRYYATNFGRKVIAKRQISTWWLVPFVLYNVLGFWLNAKFPEIPSGAPTVWTVALLSVFIAIRDWPWRSYYLLAPVACGLAFAATLSGQASYLPILFLTLGASMVAIGLLDHLMLVRLVKEARETALASNPVRSE